MKIYFRNIDILKLFLYTDTSGKMLFYKKDVFKIFADAHKIIATEMHNNIVNIYDIKLDEKSLLWGSILPDVLPKYKFIRHYKDESLEYITKEIIDIILSNSRLDLEGKVDSLSLKLLSKRIGIVSHYLSDYTCLAHAKRWTFNDSFMKHIKYESKLNEIAMNHSFKKDKIQIRDLNILDVNSEDLENYVRDYINHIVEDEYMIKEGFSNDLNFALSLNMKISNFILDSIKVYSEEFKGHFALEI